MASNDDIPKWKIALALGIPVTALSVAAIWYFRKRKLRDVKENVKEPIPTIKNDAPSQPDAEQTPLEKVQAIKNRGNKYFKGNNYQKAIECYTEAIGLCPLENKQELATFFQNRAATYEQLKDWDNVLADCNSALQYDSRYIKALSRRAKVYEQKEMYLECLEDITAVCILEQFQNQASIVTADRVLKELGSQKAKENVKNKPPISPSRQTIHQYFSSFANDPLFNEEKENNIAHPSENGDVNGVNDNNKQEENTDKEINHSYYAEALDAFHNGRYNEIVALCTQEIDNSNSNKLYESLLLRATFSMLQGEGDKALDDFNRLLEMKDVPKRFRSNALIKRGSMFMQIGMEEESRKDFALATTEDCSNSDIFHHRGQLNLLTGNMDAALQDFEQSVSLNPKFAITQVQKKFTEYTLAKSMSDMMQMQKVLSEFAELVQRFNQSAEGYILYGQALCDMQRFDEADDNFRIALELEKDNGNTYVHRGLLQLQWKQDIKEASRLMHKAIQIDAGCEFAYQTLATLEVQCGNIENAIDLFNKAIQLAKTEIELTHLYSMLHAAIAQATVAKRFGVDLSALGAGPLFAN